MNIKEEKTVIVMGNGPSLKNVDFSIFDGFDTFGMNGAYRYYYENNWWPTYFGCFDDRVIDCHEEAWKNMIEDPNVPIRRYFLRKKISGHSKLTVLCNDSSNIGEFSDSFDTFGYGGNTGANCCQAAICMGYTKIILIGVECNYVEVVDGAKITKEGRLEMVKTPKDNPNYFFGNYQQKGDKFNLPRANIFHLPAWKSLSKFAAERNVEIVNCSQISKLECFRKSTLEKELTMKKFDNLEKMCFFLGCNRSGSSLMRSILTAHKNVLISHEVGRTNIYNKILAGNISRKDALATFYNDAINSDPVSEKITYDKTIGRNIIGEYKNYINGQFQGRVTSLKVLGDKSGPWFVDVAYEYADVHKRMEDFFEKKIYYIHTVRNPLDNIYSIYSGDRDLRPFFKWNDNTKKTLEFLPPERVMTIDLELIVEKRHWPIKRMFEFLGVEVDIPFVKDCASVVMESLPHKDYADFFSKDDLLELKKRICEYSWYDKYSL